MVCTVTLNNIITIFTLVDSRSWGLPGAQVDWVPDVGIVV